MFEDYECEGEWWLPSNPTKKLYGKLTFSKETWPKLELNGVLEEYSVLTVFDFSINAMPFKHEIILGLSKKGENVTAVNCQGYPSLLNGFDSSTFTVSKIFVGLHFEKEEDIKFNSLTISFSFLDQWVNASWAKITKEKGKRPVRPYV